MNSLKLNIFRKFPEVHKELLEWCKNTLSKELDSLYLTGSFGNNEGIIKVINGKTLLINDVDFVLCTPRSLEIKSLTAQLQKIIPCNQVDLKVLNVKSFMIGNRIEDLDFYQSSKLLYGVHNEWILNKNNNKIPIFEAIKPFYVYSSTLCQSLYYKKILRADFWGDQQLCKYLCGLSISHTVLSNTYLSTYQERFEHMMNDPALTDDFVGLFNWASDFRKSEVDNLLPTEKYEDDIELTLQLRAYYEKRIMKNYFVAGIKDHPSVWMRRLRKGGADYFRKD